MSHNIFLLFCFSQERIDTVFRAFSNAPQVGVPLHKAKNVNITYQDMLTKAKQIIEYLQWKTLHPGEEDPEKEELVEYAELMTLFLQFKQDKSFFNLLTLTKIRNMGTSLSQE